jgi:hypothetical protein
MINYLLASENETVLSHGEKLAMANSVGRSPPGSCAMKTSGQTKWK